ncbi:cytochrome P450 [Pararhizobium mangrovi]|uniref:Cytochrome P450 n=1 Tax=Pararhizobium mangrovi TaxID=2590452 RepID=A0A506U096_9HYPH|nr:cytochrome P450 [Pararhizobium mangrovi]TPW26404.1 cytochrome P450 [Pararhizobium mangrovi]
MDLSSTVGGGHSRLAASSHDPALYADPYRTYAAIHRAGGTVFWEDLGHWCFAGHARVNDLLRDRRFGRQILHIATREELGMAPPASHVKDFDAAEAHSLLELEPPAHTRLRTLVNRAFVSRKVEGMRSEIEALAHNLIDSFESDGEVELLSRFGEVLPVTVIAWMLGLPATDGPKLLAWSHAMVRMYLFERTREDEVAANTASRAFTTYLLERIAEKRRRPGDDLLTHMITAERGGERLSDAECVSTAILLLNAGHEATVHQIGNAVRTILESDRDATTLFRTAERTAATVEECLRFDPPLHLFMRHVLADCEIDRIALKKGERIGLFLAAANRDPVHFEEPDRFDPDRTRKDHLSFGAGLHFCLGAPLARLELQIALPALFARLPGLRLAQKPQVADTFHFHGLERLDLFW